MGLAHINNMCFNMSHLGNVFSAFSLKMQTTYQCNNPHNNSLTRHLSSHSYTDHKTSHTAPEYQCEKVAHITVLTSIHHKHNYSFRGDIFIALITLHVYHESILCFQTINGNRYSLEYKTLVILVTRLECSQQLYAEQVAKQ